MEEAGTGARREPKPTEMTRYYRSRATRPDLCAPGAKFRNIVLPTRIFLETPLDPRLTQIRNWLTGLPASLNLAVDTLRPASADASFRRYFRLDAGDRTLIVMDAPPEHEDCRPFLHVGGLLRGVGLNVPAVLEQDLGQGCCCCPTWASRTTSSASAPASATASCRPCTAKPWPPWSRCSRRRSPAWRPTIRPDWRRSSRSSRNGT